jgi:GTPase SAR1 family protein
MDKPEKIKANTNYIFAFGNVGVGKSTIMAAIAKILFEHTVVLHNPKNLKGNQFLLMQWLEKLNSFEFPPRSRKGEIFEIDMGVEFFKAEESNFLQITFLEMAGEDLSAGDMREGEYKLLEEFEQYINAAKLFLVVTDVNSAKKDDLLIWQFFNKLLEHNLLDKPVALVVSKWDLKENQSDFKDFVNTNLVQTANWLRSEKLNNPKVFPFSIGKISEEDKIDTLDLKYTKDLSKWIYEILTN